MVTFIPMCLYSDDIGCVCPHETIFNQLQHASTQFDFEPKGVS